MQQLIIEDIDCGRHVGYKSMGRSQDWTRVLPGGQHAGSRGRSSRCQEGQEVIDRKQDLMRAANDSTCGVQFNGALTRSDSRFARWSTCRRSRAIIKMPGRTASHLPRARFDAADNSMRRSQDLTGDDRAWIGMESFWKHVVERY